MDFQKLDKNAIISWRIGRGIGFLVLIAIIAGVLNLSKLWEMQSIYKNYLYMAAGLLIIYNLIGIIIYPEIEYRQWRYVITKDKVEIRHGIFFVTTTVVPIVRIQHITISKGPIYRKLGLSKVKIFLASGSFEILGLSENIANMISENLKARVIERLHQNDQAKI